MRDGRIETEGLTKRFGPVLAVDSLSFTAEPGSVTGLLGCTGAGKTTVLRLLLGLVRPDQGIATIGGRRFAELDSPGRLVGAVLDAQRVHPGRSGRNHLRCHAAALGVSAGRVTDLIRLVGLDQVAGQAARSYPPGTRQRLALATALLGDPRVLVLDEPTTSLGPLGAAWLGNFLRDFAQSGRTVLVSSRLLAEVEQTADRVVVLHRGQCVHRGSLADLRASQRRVVVDPANPAALVAALRQAGLGDIDFVREDRLVVHDTDCHQVGTIARAAGVALRALAEDRTALEGVLHRLTAGQPAAGHHQQRWSGPWGGQG